MTGDFFDKAIFRISELLEFGEDLRQNKRHNVEIYGYYVDREPANQWRTSCLNIISRIFGKNSIHYNEFDTYDSAGYNDGEYIDKGIGVLRSALDDIKGGWLFDAKTLIQADIFADFLEQASHLLENEYHSPAAVVAGAVLEDGLRKLCDQNEITLPSKPKIDGMNAELVKKGIYNKLKQKRITALADIRNNAAHGKWSEFTADDVGRMIEEVEQFMSDFFK